MFMFFNEENQIIDTRWRKSDYLNNSYVKIHNFPMCLDISNDINIENTLETIYMYLINIIYSIAGLPGFRSQH